MNIWEMAELSDIARQNELHSLAQQIEPLLRQRAMCLAAEAIAELRAVFPEAAFCKFEGPQEPGATAWILELAASDGSAVYDGDVADEGMTVAQDFLTGALEADADIFLSGPGGTYLLPLGYA